MSEREIVAEAWAFRWYVEREASLRFAQLGEAIAQTAGHSEVVMMAQRAASDETRHAGYCAELAQSYGAILDPHLAHPPLEQIVPAGLTRSQAVLYEAVAACCVTETLSAAVLSILLERARSAPMKKVLRELLRDEVVHGRLGWAHLTHQAQRMDTTFLSRYLPAMLAGAESEELFQPGDAAVESEGLIEHGVLPRSLKRIVFMQTVEEVILPGLWTAGVDVHYAAEWLRTRPDPTVSSYTITSPP